MGVFLELALRHDSIVRSSWHILSVYTSKERDKVVLVIAHVLCRNAASVVWVVRLPSALPVKISYLFIRQQSQLTQLIGDGREHAMSVRLDLKDVTVHDVAGMREDLQLLLPLLL